MRQEHHARVVPPIYVGGREAKQREGGGFGLLTILAWPVMVPYKIVTGAAAAVKEELDDELYNPGRVQKELTDLHMMHEMGEIEDEEFESRTDVLLQRLNEIREREEQERAT